MSRVQITDTVIQPAPDYLKGVDGAQVTVTPRAGGTANLYQAETGSGTWANPLTTRDGRIEPNEQAGAPVWVDTGSYDIVVNANGTGSSYTTAFEAISATGNQANEIAADVQVLASRPVNLALHPTYDPVASDNSATLTATLTDAGAGGKVYIPYRATPYIVGDVAFTQEGQSITGDGSTYPGYGTVLRAKAGATYVLKGQGKRWLGLSDLMLEGNSKAASGFFYEAVSAPAATAQNLALNRVHFLRCDRGWHIGAGGAINQADKNTAYDCNFTESNDGIVQEAVNSQETILVNAGITACLRGVSIGGGTLDMIGGQFQVDGGTNSKGILLSGANVQWINLASVIFEGPDVDIDGTAHWPDILVMRNCVLQGAGGTIINSRNGTKTIAEYCRFNNTAPVFNAVDQVFEELYSHNLSLAPNTAGATQFRHVKRAINGFDEISHASYLRSVVNSSTPLTLVGTASQTSALEQFHRGATVKSQISSQGAFVSNDAAQGIVLKDTQGTPHYWRVTVSTTGVLTTADLGTTMPN